MCLTTVPELRERQDQHSKFVLPSLIPLVGFLLSVIEMSVTPIHFMLPLVVVVEIIRAVHGRWYEHLPSPRFSYTKYIHSNINLSNSIIFGLFKFFGYT